MSDNEEIKLIKKIRIFNTHKAIPLDELIIYNSKQDAINFMIDNPDKFKKGEEYCFFETVIIE